MGSLQRQALPSSFNKMKRFMGNLMGGSKKNEEKQSKSEDIRDEGLQGNSNQGQVENEKMEVENVRIKTEVTLEKKDGDGKPTGDAVVKLKNQAELQKALSCNKKYDKNERYIVVEETESQTYEKSKTENPINSFVKLGSLVWGASEKDIKDFLTGCNVVEVVIARDERGRPSGNGFVRLESKADIEKALACNKKYLGKRWVAVEEIGEDDFITGKDKEQKGSSRENEEKYTMNTKESKASFIKLGSLTWKATEDDIKTFLDGCKVKDVIITTNERGKPSGNAFVKLEAKADVERAKTYNKKYLGERWVTVDEITEHEYSKETQSDKNGFAKLGSLSWSATEEDIETFLDGCKIKEVIITKNERGKPSGNAFVRFEGEPDVEKAKSYNKKYLRERWVTVDEITEDEFTRETKSTEFIKETMSEKNSFVKLGSLSWTATEEDIKIFLDGCKIKEVIIETNERGKPSGNAFVRLEGKADAEKARTFNKEYLGKRWVTVDNITEDLFIEGTKFGKIVKKAKPSEVINDTNSGKTCFVKLGSLSWTVSEKDITTFLDGCEIREVIIATNEKGKPSGDAFVKLRTHADAEKARTFNKKYIGQRWVTVDKIEEEEYKEKTEKYRDPVGTEYSCNHVDLTNLDFNSTDNDIKYELLDDCPDLICIKSREGEALVQLEKVEDQVIALNCSGNELGGRRIGVQKAKITEHFNWLVKNHYIQKPIATTTNKTNFVDNGDFEECTPDSPKPKTPKMDPQESKMEVEGNFYKFSIKPFDTIEDVRDVLENCKDVEIDGVIWEKGNVVPLSEVKSKIILECTSTNAKADAEFIKTELENVAEVEDVTITD